MWACPAAPLRAPAPLSHPPICPRMCLEHLVCTGLHQAATGLGASSLWASAAQPSPSCHCNMGPGMPRTPVLPSAACVRATVWPRPATCCSRLGSGDV